MIYEDGSLKASATKNSERLKPFATTNKLKEWLL
jgi:hypothetical protein